MDRQQKHFLNLFFKSPILLLKHTMRSNDKNNKKAELKKYL